MEDPYPSSVRLAQLREWWEEGVMVPGLPGDYGLTPEDAVVGHKIGSDVAQAVYDLSWAAGHRPTHHYAEWPAWLIALAKRLTELRSPSQRYGASKIKRVAQKCFADPDFATQLDVLARLGSKEQVIAWLRKQRVK